MARISKDLYQQVCDLAAALDLHKTDMLERLVTIGLKFFIKEKNL
jgi:hypothetical protein